MVRDINGLGGFSTPQTVTEQSPNTASKKTADNAGSNSAATADDVNISDGAKTLQALAAKIGDLPEVNIERAEQIKVALESGEYQIDDLVLADKILNSEALLSD